MRAPGLLRAFCDAGVLVAADVHVALRLERLGGEDRDAVLLAAALAVRGVRSGSVCVDLATAADTVAPGEDVEPVELPSEVALQLVIAANELVFNARKHAYGGQEGAR